MTERPSIPFIFTDDRRHDTVRSLGYPAVATPHLDRDRHVCLWPHGTGVACLMCDVGPQGNTIQDASRKSENMQQ